MLAEVTAKNVGIFFETQCQTLEPNLTQQYIQKHTPHTS